MRRRLLRPALAGAILAIGGWFAYCEGLHDGWGAALRGLLATGKRDYERKTPEWYRSEEELIVRYPVDVSACGTKKTESRWFRVRRRDLFAAGNRPPANLFESHQGDIPAAVRAQVRKMRLGSHIAGDWPKNLTAAFGDCVVWSFSDGQLASDCDGAQAVVVQPDLLPYTWTERSWWRYPAIILGFPFALAFDAVTVPLNAAVLAVFVLPLAVPELARHRRLFWRVGLAVAATYDLTALLFLGLPRGHTGGGGLGGLIDVGSAIVAALASAAVPFVAGLVVARETQRRGFLSLGILFAAICSALLIVLLLAEKSPLEPAESFLELLVHPPALVPGLFALGLVCWGCKRAAPRASEPTTPMS